MTRTDRAGFTMPELAITMVLLAILTAMVLTGARRAITRSKVDRAASVVAADLEQAFSIGGRLRRPVRIQYRADSLSYRVSDVSDGTVRLARSLGRDTPYGVTTLTFRPDSITILPPGRSSAPLCVTLRSDDRQRQVTVSSAGFVRVGPCP